MSLGEKRKWWGMVGLVGSIMASLVAGCAQRHAVIASTGTTLGVEISQNPQTQMYQARLGYNRGEIAIVPTNRSADEDPYSSCTANITNNGGARNSSDVLMELRFAGLFSVAEGSGLYQRLAVGTEAVKQPGAAFMFAKGHKGELDQETARMVSQSLRTIAETPTDVSAARVPLALAYTKLHSTKKEVFDAAARSEGYADFHSFLLDIPPSLTREKVNKIRQQLEGDPDIKAKLGEIDEIRKAR